MDTDILTPGDAADAVGVDPSDNLEMGAVRALLSSATALLDARCGPVISRGLVTCGTTTASTVVVLDSGETEKTMGQVRVGDRVDIGTAADPWAVAADRLVTKVDTTNQQITVDGDAVTTTGSHTVRVGRFADRSAMAADPAGAVFVQAAREIVRHHWAMERGAPSSVYDDLGVTATEPWSIPTRVLGLLAAELVPGVA